MVGSHRSLPFNLEVAMYVDSLTRGIGVGKRDEDDDDSGAMPLDVEITRPGVTSGE